jgi:putative transposase
MGQVWADAACDSERHHHRIRHGARSRASPQPNAVKRAGAFKVDVVFSPNSGPSQMLKCSQNERGLKGEDQMKKSAFTEEQITYALRQVEMRPPVANVYRKLGVSEQTFYRWKRKFARMGLAELRRVRQLEEENRKFKQLVADLTLDKHMLQEVLRKKL